MRNIMLLKLTLAVLLACSGLPALADKYAVQQGSTYVVVDTEQSCSFVDKFPKELHERLRGGKAVHEGKPYKLCFVEMETDIYVFWDDGDQGIIPKNAFNKVNDV